MVGEHNCSGKGGSVLEIEALRLDWEWNAQLVPIRGLLHNHYAALDSLKQCIHMCVHAHASALTL